MVGGSGMKRILACDDSEFVRKMIKRELESSFDVVLFKDGLEAYEHLKEDPNFDFAIIDGEMPNMSGWELIKRIKQELKLYDLPVVILTATDEDFFKNEAFDLGAFDYLKKPFKTGELQNYIKAFFKSDGYKEGKVLVVEDSISQNKVICYQLKEKNIWPISAYSGEEAIKLLVGGSDVDVILMDIHLPKASGIDVAKALKRDERFSYIPIIGITSASGARAIEIMKKAFDAGIDDFITKPYNMIEFYARVRANISRSRLVKRLKEESELDFLTKLYNRRTLFRFLEHLVAMAKRGNEKLSLFIMDIDKFKEVNDTFGHQAGDEVLVNFAQIIKNNIRKADIAARFGGEEFCIVTPYTSLPEACVVSEKIRKAVRENGINVQGRRIDITVSSGIAELDKDDDIGSLIKKADDALYRAKQEGRNRSMAYKDGEFVCCPK